jgi:myo-inositol catabolism protein IolS
MLMLNNLKNCFGIGTAGFSGEGGGYGFGAVSESDSVVIIKNAVKNYGINIIDTAPIYGFGEAEKRVGKALSGLRDRAFIISKTGVSWHASKRVNMTNDPKVTRGMLEDSLRRLKVDYIDGVLVHWPDKNVDIRKTYEVLSKAKEEGKIRYLGLSNTNENEIKLAREVDSVDILQGECNIFEKDIFKNLFDKFSCYSTSWGSFDKGIASGRVTLDRKFDQFDCRSWAPWWKKSNKNKKIKIVSDLKRKIQELGGSGDEADLVKLSIETIKSTGVNCPLFGIKTLLDLENLHSSFHLSLGETSAIKRILDDN